MPSIKAIAHKYRNFKRGIRIKVLPDTGATMSLIPLSMVTRLGLKLDRSDDN